MPELPEVETTLRGIEPYIRNAKICDVLVRNSSLRWPVSEAALKALIGQSVTQLERRAKYLLLHTARESILLHLGMSGSLRVLSSEVAADKHDHLDIRFDNGFVLRLNDPRRFGCCLVVKQPVLGHRLLANLGPEPLSDDFDGEVLLERSRGRSLAVKNFIMDGKVVVGVGNIYASEALFAAGIRPGLAAKRVSLKRYQNLAKVIKEVLANAILAGGTTLNDFTKADGSPGYFKQELQVYGRAGEPCLVCSSLIKSQVLGQRSTFYCRQCQTF